MHGNTPVHYASASGYTHSLRILLEIHSHLIDAQNKEGNTPLHLAAQNGHNNVTALLLTLGACVKRNKEDVHFLDLAIKNEHKDVCVACVSHYRCVGRCIYSTIPQMSNV